MNTTLDYKSHHFHSPRLQSVVRNAIDFFCQYSYLLCAATWPFYRMWRIRFVLPWQLSIACPNC